MDIKTITLVMILSILIGIGIFTATKFLNKSPLTASTLTQNQTPQPQASSNYPSIAPIPKPSLSPINKDTNLKQEIDKLTPPDFSEDYKKLKQEFN